MTEVKWPPSGLSVSQDVGRDILECLDLRGLDLPEWSEVDDRNLFEVSKVIYRLRKMSTIADFVAVLTIAEGLCSTPALAPIKTVIAIHREALAAADASRREMGLT